MSPGRPFGRWWLNSVSATVVLATVIAGACGTDPGGHLYTALNESDRTVVIEIETGDRQSFSLPPRSRGRLSESFASPGSEWRVIVRTETCTQLVSISLADLAPDLTLRVTSAGDVVIGAAGVFSFDGKAFPLIEPPPPGTCG